MAIRIIDRTHTGLPCGEVLEILVDSEEDIKTFGDTISDNYASAKAAPGSLAYTADMSVIYQKAPSGKWVKC